MPQQRWETQGGLPTMGLMYEQLIEHLRQAQENAAMCSHLCNTEDTIRDKLLSKGWLVIAELLRQMELKVTELAQGRLQ